MRATPCSVGRQGRSAKVRGSGWAIMSDSSIALKPVMLEPSKPMPSSKASSSSSTLIEKDFSWPRMSVNQKRMKRMSRSWTIALTSSAVCGWSGMAGDPRPSPLDRRSGCDGPAGPAARSARDCSTDPGEPAMLTSVSARGGVGDRLGARRSSRPRACSWTCTAGPLRPGRAGAGSAGGPPRARRAVELVGKRDVVGDAGRRGARACAVRGPARGGAVRRRARCARGEGTCRGAARSGSARRPVARPAPSRPGGGTCRAATAPRRTGGPLRSVSSSWTWNRLMGSAWRLGRPCLRRV